MSPHAGSTVLLVQYSSRRDGSAFSGLLLADGLRRAGWCTHVAFAAPGPMVEVYREAGHTPHVAPHDNWLRRGRPHHFARDVAVEVARGLRLIRLVRAVGADVVYVNTAVSLAGVVAARGAGVPCLWHLRELFADGGGELVAPPAVRPLVRRAFRHLPSHLVANSRAVARDVLGEGGGRVDVVPNAVEASFFEDHRSRHEARAVFGLPPDATLVGVPGTLRPMKGHPFFFRAVAPLLAAHPAWHVVVTGGGRPAYVAELEARVAELGLAGRVRFLGSITDMRAFYRAVDVAVIPSRAEPFGRTVIEAMAMGTPVVATRVGGIPEIVDDGRTGLLVPYGDPTAMGRAVTVAIERPGLAARLAEGAREVAERAYRAEVYQQRLAEIVAQTTRPAGSERKPTADLPGAS